MNLPGYGIILLAIWLIAEGIGRIWPYPPPIPLILGILAIAAGILLMIGR